MTQKEIQLKDLTLMLQRLDTSLLQRAADYVKGLVDASTDEEHDWWDDLPESVKKSYELGMKDIEEGNLIPMEEVMKKYR